MVSENAQTHAAVSEVLQLAEAAGSPAASAALLLGALRSTALSLEARGACMTVLSSTLRRSPSAAVQVSKAAQENSALLILKEVAETLISDESSSAEVVRASVQCLGALLRARPEDQEWRGGSSSLESRVVEAMSKLCCDPRPKVRREAGDQLAATLQALPDQHTNTSLTNAKVVAVSVGVLEGVGAAAAGVVGLKGAALRTAEEALTRSAAQALHLSITLKAVMPHMSSGAGATLCEHLVVMFASSQPVLSQAAIEALTEAGSHSESKLGARALAKTMGKVLQATYDKRDLPLVLGLQQFLQRGMVRLHSLDPALSGVHLAGAVHALLPHLRSSAEGVRRGGHQTLLTLIRSCIDSSMVQKAVHRMAIMEQDEDSTGANRGTASTLESVAVAVASTLSYRYRAVWGESLSLAACLVERLGPVSSVLLPSVLTSLGELATLRDKPSWTAVQSCVGVMLRVMGPEKVLAALPLNLMAAVQHKPKMKITDQMEEDDEEEEDWLAVKGCNAWLLPLLKHHLCGAPLSFFTQHLLPLAKQLASFSSSAAASGRPLEAQRAATAEFQIWMTLPSFCHWTHDTATAFPAIARELGAYLTHRKDLQGLLCAALTRLLQQNRRALTGASAAACPDDDDEDEVEAEKGEKTGGEAEAAAVAPGGHDPPPPFYTPQLALANLHAVTRFTRNFLPILFNMFVAAPPGERAVLHRCCAEFSAACAPDGPLTVQVGESGVPEGVAADASAALDTFFKTCMRKLLRVTQEAALPPDSSVKVLEEGGPTPTARKCTFLQLALALESGVSEECARMILTAARPLLLESDGSVQKKGYKALTQLCQRRPQLFIPHLPDLHQALVAGLPVCTPAARRNRLRCLGEVVTLLTRTSSTSSQTTKPTSGASLPPISLDLGTVLPQFISEIVLGTKEVNAKTRLVAFDLIVRIAHIFQEQEEEMEGEEDEMAEVGSRLPFRGLAGFFNLVAANLAGSSSTMVGAAVLALARLLFEFSAALLYTVPTLLPSVLMLLRTGQRETVKAVLGFVRVVVMRVPATGLLEYLPQLLEAILTWGQEATRGRFRAKVRILVERMIRRCGEAAVVGAVPAGHDKLVTHIRKTKERAQRKRRAGHSEKEGGGRGGSRSLHSQAHTARASEWNHSAIFSDGDDDDDETAAKSVFSAFSGGAGARAKSVREGSQARSAGGASRMSAARGGARLAEDTLDLLDEGAMRRAVINRGSQGAKRGRRFGKDEDEEFGVDRESGKLIIKEVSKWASRKRGREDDDEERGEEEDGSQDGSDDRMGGARSVGSRGPPSKSGRSQGGKSNAGKSQGGRSTGGKSNARSASGERANKRRRSDVHSKDVFKPKKKGTGGDTKIGGSKLDPYAYWRFDPKMMNARPSKQREGKKGLERLLKAKKGTTAQASRSQRRAKKKH